MDVSADQLKYAVEKQHGGKATLVTKLPVKEIFEGKTVWEGVVHIFDLERHPAATRAYAWSSQDGDRRRAYAVLHLGSIGSPRDAVQATLASERKTGK
jgi:hypothetical protein